MKEKTCKNVRFYYGIIFGAFTIIVGALFIWQVLSVYLTGTAEGFTGAHPFSRERVLAALSKISLFFWLWLAGIVAGAVLFEVFPVKEKPRKICPDLQYARLIKRLPASVEEGSAAEYKLVTEERKIIFALKCAATALFAVAAVYGVVYLCIPANFPGEDVTHEMLAFASHVFPCIFAGLIVICWAALYEKFAIKRILPSVQKLTKGQKVQKNLTVIAKIEAFFDDWRVILAIRIALAVAAVALIIVGALNGNARAVFIKAINICTECIGLG